MYVAFIVSFIEVFCAGTHPPTHTREKRARKNKRERKRKDRKNKLCQLCGPGTRCDSRAFRDQCAHISQVPFLGF